MSRPMDRSVRSSGTVIPSWTENLARDVINETAYCSSLAEVAELMRNLGEQLTGIRQFAQWDKRSPRIAQLKAQYRLSAALSGHEDPVTSVQVLPDGQIISASRDWTVRMWKRDADDWSVSDMIEGHKDWINSVHVVPDGSVVTGCDDETVSIWTQNTRGCWERECLRGHDDRVTCVQALFNGRIVSGSFDGTVRVWERNSTGEWSSHVLRGNNRPVLSLHVLPDETIVSAGRDAAIWIWRRSSTDAWLSDQIKGHSDTINCLQVLQDGKIVSGSDDRTLRVWSRNPQGIWESEVLIGHRAAITSVQELGNGLIVSGSADGTLRLWTNKRMVRERWTSRLWKRAQHEHSSLLLRAREFMNQIRSSGGECNNPGQLSQSHTPAREWRGDLLVQTSQPILSFDIASDGSIVIGGGGYSFLSMWNDR